MRLLAIVVLSFGLLGLCGSRASAQTDFSGTWSLDRDISGDLSKATFEPQQTQAKRNDSGFTGGFGGRGFGGGRSGSSSRRPTPPSDGSRGGTAPLTDDEKARLHDLALYVRGLASLVVEHTDHSTFTVTDGLGRSHLFLTDGTKTPQAFGGSTIDTVTKWDGPHLVTVYTIGPSHDVVFTYILVPTTKQVALRIQLEAGGHASPEVPELKLVYKLKPPTPKTPSDLPK